MSNVVKCDICGKNVYHNSTKYCECAQLKETYHIVWDPEGKKSYSHTYDICGKGFDMHLRSLLHV
jgi:ribosomal protein L37E